MESIWNQVGSEPRYEKSNAGSGDMWGAQHRVVSGAWIDENDEWMASEQLESFLVWMEPAAMVSSSRRRKIIAS